MRQYIVLTTDSKMGIRQKTNWLHVELCMDSGTSRNIPHKEDTKLSFECLQMKLCNTFYTHIVVFLASDCEIRDETWKKLEKLEWPVYRNNTDWDKTGW